MKHLTDIEMKNRRSMLFRGVTSLDAEDRSSILVACRQMKAKFEDYRLRLTKNQVITSIAILDPQHKGKNLTERVKSQTVAYIRSLLPDSPPQPSASRSTSSKRAKITHHDWYDSIIRPSETPESSSLTADKQLDAYLDEAACKDGSSFISWWERIGQTLYPALAPIARELLCISATSAPAKRLFSAARSTVNYKRNRLTAQSIETLVTVKCWLRGHNTTLYDVVLAKDMDEDD